jgi:tRNA nucleotidyltransferase (CCA-adding enzyme)
MSRGSYLLANITQKIEKSLNLECLALIRHIGQLSNKLNYSVYLVGGTVRDVLLNRPNVDIDLVVEGDAIALTRSLVKALGGKSKTHPRFGTANLSLDSQNIDLVTARSETYEKPGALPVIKPGTLESDLTRRDFTINSMAASINTADFGEMIDYHGGLDDLKSGLIRVLHPKSFTDDATRILRAVRYEQRLGFKIEPDTEGWLVRDLPMIDTISGDRIRHEIELMFKESFPTKALKRADELGVLKPLSPSLDVNEWLKNKLDKVHEQGTNGKLTSSIALLTYNLSEEEARGFLKRLSISGKTAQTIIEVHRIKKELKEVSAVNTPLSYIYRIFENFPLEAIEIVISAEETSVATTHLQLYLDKLSKTQPILDGEDLKKMGITTGRKIGNILKHLKNAKLDNKVQTRSDEERLVKLLLRGDKP